MDPAESRSSSHFHLPSSADHAYEMNTRTPREWECSKQFDTHKRRSAECFKQFAGGLVLATLYFQSRTSLPRDRLLPLQTQEPYDKVHKRRTGPACRRL